MFKNLKKLLPLLLVLFSPFLKAQTPGFAISTNPFHFFANGGSAAVEFGFSDFSFTAGYAMFKMGLSKSVSPKVSAKTSMMGLNDSLASLSDESSQYLPFFSL